MFQGLSVVPCKWADPAILDRLEGLGAAFYNGGSLVSSETLRKWWRTVARSVGTSRQRLCRSAGREVWRFGERAGGGIQPALRRGGVLSGARSWWTRWCEMPKIAAASLMLIPLSVSTATAWRVRSIAR